MTVELPQLSLKLGDIRILRKIGCGAAGDVFEAKITQVAQSPVALKIFRFHKFGDYVYHFSRSTGLPLSPFDREFKSYSTILNDPEAKTSRPAVHAYGWFEIPEQLQIGQFQLSQNHPLKVIVKDLEIGPPFDFNLISPAQMMKHRQIFNRLRIYITDVDKIDNYFRGRLGDFSASYVLTDLSRQESFNLADQCPRLMETVLRALGVLLSKRYSTAEVEKEWQHQQLIWREKQKGHIETEE